MNNISPEHLVTVTQGATPVQIVILTLLGVIAFWAVISVTKWVINLKMGSLPNDIAGIRDDLYEMKVQLAELRGELWSKDEVKNLIDAAILEHVKQCPHHRNYSPKGSD